MTWWQWAIGVVEFILAWKVTDLYVMRNHPKRVQAREDRQTKRAADQHPVFDIPSCRFCGRVAFSIYPNGDGPMCHRCLSERYSPTPFVSPLRQHPDDVMHQMIKLRDAGVWTGNDLIRKEFEKQYRQVMDL